MQQDMNMQEPYIHVGIMANATVKVILDGDYVHDGATLSGKQEFAAVPGGIAWNGQVYESLFFSPCDEEAASFLLPHVTIGIGFHWQQDEAQRFCGGIELVREDDKVRVINHVRVEEYLSSVISSEMRATSSVELLKAHAVISRSWLLAQIAKRQQLQDDATPYSACETSYDEVIRWYDREEHTGFDVCADDHCQRYQGIGKATTAAVREAIAATRGRVLCYGDKIADARFSKCCGGATELFENCWEDTPHRYLQARRDNDSGTLPRLTDEAEARGWILSSPDAFCNTNDAHILSQVLNDYDQDTAHFYRWEVRYTQAYLSELVRRRSGIDLGTIEELQPVERGASGRIVKLRITGSRRSIVVGKELEIRRWLSESHLYSSAFVVEKCEGEGQTTFVLHGAGWGHGVGLCQIGAAVMSTRGYSYEQILAHYFAGTTLERLYE